jgi:hypothetical protein
VVADAYYHRGVYLLFHHLRRVVRKYSERIASLPDRVMIWQIFPPKGWILLAIMIGLGITLKHIPDVPMSFTTSFYSGLGPMLIVAALRYALNLLRNNKGNTST